MGVIKTQSRDRGRDQDRELAFFFLKNAILG